MLRHVRVTVTDTQSITSLIWVVHGGSYATPDRVCGSVHVRLHQPFNPPSLWGGTTRVLVSSEYKM